jgi:exodeoxyribonuclease VII small subunit
MAKKELSFEEAMIRLEEIVDSLESGDFSLEESLKLYEEGVKLASKCANELEVAKRKIQILQQGKDGGIDVVDVPEGTFAEG